MRFRLWEIISLAVLLVFAIAFGAMKSAWYGFSYFSAVFVFAMLIIIIINRIFYINDLKLDFLEKEDQYFAELLNNGYITREQFENRDIRILKGYYRDYFRSRKLQIILIFLLFFIIIAIIFAIFKL